MSARRQVDLPASIPQPLLNLSRARGEDFHLLQTAYAMERFFYRLSKSRHGGGFGLKGAWPLEVWTERRHRPRRGWPSLHPAASPLTPTLSPAGRRSRRSRPGRPSVPPVRRWLTANR